MKIIIDECLPKRVIHLFPDHQVWTVPQIKLAGYKDTQLLDELENKNIDVFITIDGNIEYQQKFSNRTFGTIVIRSVSSRYADLLVFKSELLRTINHVSPGQVYHVPSGD